MSENVWLPGLYPIMPCQTENTDLVIMTLLVQILIILSYSCISLDDYSKESIYGNLYIKLMDKALD